MNRNLILHKAASILVYRYYQAQNYWFLNDYKDASDIINSRAVIEFILEDIAMTLDKGEGIFSEIRMYDLIDFRDNLRSKLEFANRVCGVEEYADVNLDSDDDTVYMYCTKDEHWTPVPMSLMAYLSPNDQYELGAGLRDLIVEYNAARESYEITGDKVTDNFDAILYTTTTDLVYDTELTTEIRNLSYRFFNHVIKGDESEEDYWNETFRIWYEMDTILDELGSSYYLTAEQKTCLSDLRFNRFSIQAEKDIWISYKKSDERILSLSSGLEESYREIPVASL